jgi:phospholipid/cholesterol/gamma-HCH transport system substrate-binding protein
MAVLPGRLLGVVFLLVIGLLLTGIVLLGRGSVLRAVVVTARVDRTGNELAELADVKVRGLLVGQVRRITATGRGAEVELALRPDAAATLPDNVTARLRPKSLFGERYVDLALPARPAAEHLRDGDVIGQDSSAAATEVDRVLADLLPTLQAVQPQKLSTTLTALSQALAGRGRPLGQTLAALGDYLGRFDQRLPDLEADLRELSTVTDIYREAAPDLLRALDDLATTSATVVQQRRDLDALYATLTTASGDLAGFLRANRDNLIALAGASRPTLELLGEYAPEYPCVLRQLADLVPRADAVMGRGTDEPGAHITFEVSVVTGTQYVPGRDTIRYGEHRGPRCYSTTPPFPEIKLDDGTAYRPKSNQDGAVQATVASAAGGLGLMNSPAERDFLAALLAPGLGEPAERVPNWATVLVGPLYRGAAVAVR